MIDLFPLVRPFLERMEPEKAHRFAVSALARGLGPVDRRPDDPVLAVEAMGMSFSNPVGLAAGFDKDAEAVPALMRMGFGFVEVGSITPKPQTGNPRPRVFRAPEQGAIINRYGFNSGGHKAALERLETLPTPHRAPLGINLGRNKDQADPVADYVAGVEAFGEIADYLVVNVSSPNTPGLRALQDPRPLAELVSAAQAASRRTERRPPVLVKIAPDLGPEDLAAVAGVALDLSIDGLLVGNTTTSRPQGLPSDFAAQPGGLSGRPLMALSTTVLARTAQLTEGRITLIGVGGIASGADAYAKIRAGAALVQLYTALVFEGPGLVRRIKKELAELLARDGFASIDRAIGADLA